jgi:hypothetical protein
LQTKDRRRLSRKLVFKTLVLKTTLILRSSQHEGGQTRHRLSSCADSSWAGRTRLFNLHEEEMNQMEPFETTKYSTLCQQERSTSHITTLPISSHHVPAAPSRNNTVNISSRFIQLEPDNHDKKINKRRIRKKSCKEIQITPREEKTMRFIAGSATSSTTTRKPRRFIRRDTRKEKQRIYFP